MVARTARETEHASLLGVALVSAVLLDASPALACGACSPTDIRFVGILTAIALGVWGTLRVGEWIGRQHPNRET